MVSCYRAVTVTLFLEDKPLVLVALLQRLSQRDISTFLVTWSRCSQPVQRHIVGEGFAPLFAPTQRWVEATAKCKGCVQQHPTNLPGQADNLLLLLWSWSESKKGGGVRCRKSFREIECFVDRLRFSSLCVWFNARRNAIQASAGHRSLPARKRTRGK